MSKGRKPNRVVVLEKIAEECRRELEICTPVALDPIKRKRVIKGAFVEPKKADRRITDLEDAAQQMLEHWSGRSPEDIRKNYEKYSEDRKDFDKAVGRAIRAGLLEHPIVRNWIAERRSLGDRDILRRYKDQRLERGVKGGISKEDLWLLYESHDLINGKRGYKAIRKALINRITVADEKALRRWKEEFGFEGNELKILRARLKQTSLQNFRKWCKRLGILWSHQDERLGDDKQETRVSTTKSVQI